MCGPGEDLERGFEGDLLVRVDGRDVDEWASEDPEEAAVDASVESGI